jgi:hypothetical protein
MVAVFAPVRKRAAGVPQSGAVGPSHGTIVEITLHLRSTASRRCVVCEASPKATQSMRARKSEHDRNCALCHGSWQKPPWPGGGSGYRVLRPSNVLSVGPWRNRRHNVCISGVAVPSDLQRRLATKQIRVFDNPQQKQRNAGVVQW